MITILPNTRIYVLCPAKVATGGPELLHQLCYHLRNTFGYEAYMYYYPPNHPNPIHPAYKCYNNPYACEIEDLEKNVLISPEVNQALNLLTNYRRIRKIVWFLSIDNYFLSRIKRTDFLIRRALVKILRVSKPTSLLEIHMDKIAERYPLEKDQRLKNVNGVMAQSKRALEFLASKGFSPVYYLSDYLNEEFLRETYNPERKEDIVVYNPAKGFQFTIKIIQQAPSLKFIPVKNLTRTQVIDLLKRSKVYIDFGNHPGKDRLPREAAILGCCVITGMKGCASYFEDLPIPSEYKFEDKVENIPKIVQKIEDCLQNYYERIKDFDFYRTVIKGEPEKFVEDMRKIFQATNL